MKRLTICLMLSVLASCDQTPATIDAGPYIGTAEARYKSGSEWKGRVWIKFYPNDTRFDSYGLPREDRWIFIDELGGEAGGAAATYTIKGEFVDLNPGLLHISYPWVLIPSGQFFFRKRGDRLELEKLPGMNEHGIYHKLILRKTDIDPKY